MFQRWVLGIGRGAGGRVLNRVKIEEGINVGFEGSVQMRHIDDGSKW